MGPQRRQIGESLAGEPFLDALTGEVDAEYIADVRKLAVAAGREAEDIKAYAYMKIITGGTEEEAQRKYDAYYEQIDYDSAMALMSGWSGLDFGSLDPDLKVEYVETNAMRTMLQGFTDADPDREWTVDDIVRYVAIGGPGPVLVGTPEQIADELEEFDAGCNRKVGRQGRGDIELINGPDEAQDRNQIPDRALRIARAGFNLGNKFISL